MPSPGLRAISTYIQRIEQGFKPNSIYRGHADCSWVIRPSAFREGRHGIKTKEQLGRWKRIAARFVNPRPLNDFEWLVLAQHYGIATPLLDWTTNPLIGLFFACQRTETKAHGCVIRFFPDAFKSFSAPQTLGIFDEDRLEPGLLDATAMNARTLAQDSAMTLHSARMPDLRPDEDNVIQIGAGNKGAILQALKTFGFSPERLYSDLNIAAREFNDELEIDALLG